MELGEKSKTIPVMVALRCRPLIKKELEEGCQSCLMTVPGEPQVVLGKDRAFTYDYAFGPYDPQSDVYNNACRKLVDSIFKGYNATILAYGQTGSGKTYTMGGYEASLEGDEDAMGVIPRTLRDIFVTIDERQDKEITIKASYMEIYKEELNDILTSPPGKNSLSIREEGNGGIKIIGLKEVSVKTFDDTMKLLVQGSHGRTVGSTAMNSTSSRSHAVFTLHIDRKTDMGDLIHVKFHMVDLAGSERCKRTMAEGERLKEGININKGLLALGNVISALGDENSNKRQHIPYRDSKLTRILQDSLGGNSHTLMIACVSPADSNIEETLNTLRYADRARKIKNKPIINRDPQTAEIMRLKTLVQQLQSQLCGTVNETSNGSTSSTTNTSFIFPSLSKVEDFKALQERVKELEDENSELTEQLQKLVAQSSRNLIEMMGLEASNERLKMKLNLVKDHAGIDLELLSSSINADSNPRLKAELDKVQKLTGSIKATDAEDDVVEEEDDVNLSGNEDDLEKKSEENFDLEKAPATPTVRAATQRHAMQQAELQTQLGEINRMLSSKQALAEKYEAAEEKMEAMKREYEEMQREFKAKTFQWEKEKEELTSNLHNAKSAQNASKVAEQRRQRLRDLEEQMAQLKKKMAEQSKIVKMKESTDKEMGKLGGEIQLLKQQRVKLMKQMKEEASNFQKWKKDKEKQVTQLQMKNRKCEIQMTKMQRQFQKQQEVQKRRTAEAMAANKRLRDALSKQKEVEAERSSKLEKYNATGIGNRVRQWLSHELEVKVSVVEAQFHLDQLMEERKRLTQLLSELRSQLEGGPLTEKFSWLGLNGNDEDIEEQEAGIKKHMKKTEFDIELINAQIQDLQQKIVDGNQESKGTSTWQSLHTMNEAKCALKFLLSQAINARSESLRAQDEVRNMHDRDHVEEDESRKAKAKLSQEKNRHKNEIQKLKQDHEKKILELLCPDMSSKHVDHFQDALLTKESQLKAANEQLKKVEAECEDLKQRLILHKDQGVKFLPEFDPDQELHTEAKIEDSNDLNSTYDLAQPSETPESTMHNSHTSNEENKEIKKPKSRKHAALKKNASQSSLEENSSVFTDLSSNSLKRKSGEDPDCTVNKTEDKTKRRRTLLKTQATSFFTDLDLNL